MHVPVRHEEPFLPPRLPLIGPLLAPWYFRRVAARARQGDTGATRELAREYIRNPGGIMEGLLETVMLHDPPGPAVETFCDEVIRGGDSLLASWAVKHRITPATDPSRALFFLATGQIQRYQTLDSLPQRPLFRDAYLQAPETVRKRIREAVRKYRIQICLAESFLQRGGNRGSFSLSNEEWEIATEGLIAGGRCDDLYRHLLDAPVPQALYAFRALMKCGWTPGAGLRDLWMGAAACVPDRWTYPDPPVRERACLEGQEFQTRSLVFSPDATVLITAGYDGTVRSWDVRRGDLLASFCEPGMTGAPVVSSKAGMIVSEHGDGTLMLRNLRDGRVLSRIDGACHHECPLAASPNGSLLAFPSGEGVIRIIEPGTGAVAGELTGEPLRATFLAFSPDGTRIAGGNYEGRVAVWASTGGIPVMTVDGAGNDSVTGLRWSESGDQLLVISARRNPRVINMRQGSVSHGFDSPGNRQPVSVTADSRHLAMALEDGTVRIIAWAGGSERAYISVQRGGAACLALVPGEETIITGGRDGMVRIFPFSESAPSQMIRAHGERINAIAVAPDGSAFATAGWDGTVRLWDAVSGRPVRALPVQPGKLGCLCVTGDGTLLAAGTAEGLIRLWALPSGTFVRTLDAYTGAVRALALSRDGRHLATAGTDAVVRIWNPADGSLVTILSVQGGGTYSLSFAPEGTGLLAGGWDGKIRLFSLPGGDLVREFHGHSGIVTSIIPFPDGSRFASGGSDGLIRIWDTAMGDCIAFARADRRSVDAIAISPDGHVVAAGGKEKVVRLFSARDADCIVEMAGAAGPVNGLVFTPDADLLVASATDGSVAFFSTLSRTHLRNFSAHAGNTCGIGCCDRGSALVTAGNDGTVRLWNLPVSSALGSMLPDLIGSFEMGSGRHQSPHARKQWQYLSALLRLRFSDDVCLCNPPGEIEEYDIVIGG